jgi:serine/threonine protein kinase
MSKAVDTLHERNIIHRDIKLENIFITKDNNFKLGSNTIYLYVYLHFSFFFFFLGDYGVSRKEGVSMTAGPGTQFVSRIKKWKK